MGEALERAITLLTQGHRVDWEGLLDDASDDAERAQISELRGLAQLDSEHRDVDGTAADGTVGVSAPGVHAARRRWGHLELLDEIGHGASGTVYRAWDTRLARDVALKLFPDDGGTSNIEEARRLARITHSGVVAIYGADCLDGQFGLWMELLRGRTLETIIRERGPFSSREATAIALDVCGALATIHASGLVHRDIKTQNVMREPGGRLVLMDMGASVDLTRDDTGISQLAGTPLYMAPELFEGARAAVSTEIYAIGVLLYRLVTAKFPIDAATVGDVRRAHATTALRPLREVRPNLPTDYVALVERCLAHDPRSRFANVAALERALRGIDGDAAWRGARRPRLGWPLAVILTSCIVTTALGWGYRARIFGQPAEAALPTLMVSPDQHKVFTGYEELAFSKRLDDPSGAAAAVGSALSLIRPALPGNQPFYGLLHAQASSLWRRAGDLRQAGASALDGGAQMIYTVGEDHPITALLAMELARNAQAGGDHRTAAQQILRALDIRWRVLALAGLGERRIPLLDIAALEQHSRTASADVDSDGDGLLDLVELTVGLDPRSADSDGDQVFDDDEVRDGFTVSNRLALGLVASPFLDWVHYGAHEPRSLGWQSPIRFPMVERPESNPARWSVETTRGQGYFTQPLSRAQSTRAMQFGFSLLVRALPVEGAGLASIVVDAAPVGPRFDLFVRRVSEHAVEIALGSSVVPRDGQAFVVTSPVGGPGPLLELRYRPQWQSASLYVDGRRLADRYVGHHQFQDPLEGGVTWGVGQSSGPDTKASAAFQLMWLEIF